MHSLYNKHDVHTHREAEGSGGVFDGCEHGDQGAIGILMKPSAPVHSVPRPVNIFTFMPFPIPDLWCYPKESGGDGRSPVSPPAGKAEGKPK